MVKGTNRDVLCKVSSRQAPTEADIDHVQCQLFGYLNSQPGQRFVTLANITHGGPLFDCNFPVVFPALAKHQRMRNRTRSVIIHADKYKIVANQTFHTRLASVVLNNDSWHVRLGKFKKAYLVFDEHFRGLGEYTVGLPVRRRGQAVSGVTWSDDATTGEAVREVLVHAYDKFETVSVVLAINNHLVANCLCLVGKEQPSINNFRDAVPGKFYDVEPEQSRYVFACSEDKSTTAADALQAFFCRGVITPQKVFASYMIVSATLRSRRLGQSKALLCVLRLLFVAAESFGKPELVRNRGLLPLALLCEPVVASAINYIFDDLADIHGMNGMSGVAGMADSPNSSSIHSLPPAVFDFFKLYVTALPSYVRPDLVESKYDAYDPNTPDSFWWSMQKLLWDNFGTITDKLVFNGVNVAALDVVTWLHGDVFDKPSV